MTNETEVQGGSPNLAEIVKDIAERSANIKLSEIMDAEFRHCTQCDEELDDVVEFPDDGSIVDSVFVVCSNGHTTEIWL